MISLEFYNLIIRRDRLESLFKNGWQEFLEEYGSDPTIWHDQFLVRFGAMNLPDINFWISHFKNQGLKLLKKVNGTSYYCDMALVGAFQGNDNVRCVWLDIEPQTANFVEKR